MTTARTSPQAVPEPTMRRLPWYLAYVTTLSRQGVSRVSTTAIAREVNVEAAKISKDLSYLSIKGKTRVGYEVVQLEKALTEFLGYGKLHHAIMVGVGSLGSALMADVGLTRFGLDIVAGFDVNSAITGKTIMKIPVYGLEELAHYVPVLKATVAILAVPVEVAQDATYLCEQAGIKAVWNFTPARVKAQGEMTVQNVSIYSSLAIMYQKMDKKDSVPQ